MAAIAVCAILWPFALWAWFGHVLDTHPERADRLGRALFPDVYDHGCHGRWAEALELDVCADPEGSYWDTADYGRV